MKLNQYKGLKAVKKHRRSLMPMLCRNWRTFASSVPR